MTAEYVIPAGAWGETGLPTLLGQDLKLNSFDLYALHVWTWKHNPDGMSPCPRDPTDGHAGMPCAPIFKDIAPHTVG